MTDKLIVALDVDRAEEALALVDRLGDAVTFYKVGLQLAMSGTYFDLIARLHDKGKHVFADVKLYDIPQTVESAMRQLARHPVRFVTVHGHGSIVAAASRAKGAVKVLAVTVLTSFEQADLDEMGATVPVGELVLRRARKAMECGADGVIASGHEAEALRAALPKDALIVVPGIRAEPAGDDQKRIVTIEQAFARGANHVVVGRPILRAPDPRQAALDLGARIPGAST